MITKKIDLLRDLPSRILGNFEQHMIIKRIQLFFYKDEMKQKKTLRSLSPLETDWPRTGPIKLYRDQGLQDCNNTLWKLPDQTNHLPYIPTGNNCNITTQKNCDTCSIVA